MKLQDLTIDQFQRIAALEFSPVLTDYEILKHEFDSVLNNPQVQDIVSGDYGRVSLNAYAYDQAGNKGVSYGLNNIMLLSKVKNQ